MAQISFSCRGCGRRLWAPCERIGTPGRCTKCGEMMTIPGMGGVATPVRSGRRSGNGLFWGVVAIGVASFLSLVVVEANRMVHPYEPVEQVREQRDDPPPAMTLRRYLKEKPPGETLVRMRVRYAMTGGVAHLYALRVRNSEGDAQASGAAWVVRGSTAGIRLSGILADGDDHEIVARVVLRDSTSDQQPDRVDMSVLVVLKWR